MRIKHFSIIGVFLPQVLVISFFVCCFAQPVSSDVVATGDVDPTDPATWTLSTDGYIGLTGSGTLDITGGGTVSNLHGYVGYEFGSSGRVTVDGVGSTWTNSDDLYVGREGSGTMDITGGGKVSNYFGSIGSESGSTGVVTVDGVGSMWTGGWAFSVGHLGSGTLDITDGGTVNNGAAIIGYNSGSTGVVTVDGVGSTWTISDRQMPSDCCGVILVGINFVGLYGNGTLNITGGGMVSNERRGYIGSDFGSTGVVTVNGAGSKWTINGELSVGSYGIGTLDITDCGLVSVADVLTIDYNGDGDSFVNMASGGMLALMGEANGSLDEFLGLVDGTDAIRYWDRAVMGWADINGAVYGDDYMLDYITDGGDLDGYTVLTVTAVPEPCSLVLLGLGGLVLRRRRG